MKALLEDPIAHYPHATVACFDPTCGSLPRRQLDTSRTCDYLQRLAAAGVSAVLVASSTGHGHLRTVEELTEWLRVAAEVELGAMARLALLRPEDSLPVNQQLIEQCAQWGYSVVFFRRGTDLPPEATPVEVAAQLRPLVQRAAGVGLPIGLYSIPDVSGGCLVPETVARLLDGPGGEYIVAVKVTEYDFQRSTAAFLRDDRLRRLKIVQGWDPHLAQALKEGPRFDAQGRQRCGVTSGPMAFAVYQYLHLLEMARRDEWAQVDAAQRAVTQLFAAMQDDPRRFADLQRAKFVMGLGHPLTGQVDHDQVARLLLALRHVPAVADRQRLARSLDLMGDGPYHRQLVEMGQLGS